MTQAELLAALRRQHTQCAGFESDDLATDRERALDYYHQRPNGTEIAGRSTVVSGDVSAVVESNLAAMMESFSGANLASFDAIDSLDADQAQLESDAVVDFVMRQAGGRWQLAQAIKETLRLRNGWMEVDVEEERRSKIKEFTGVTPDALPTLIEEKPAEEIEVVSYDPEKKYLKLRCTYVTKKFVARATASENVVYPKSYDGCDFEALQRIPYIAKRHIESRGEAIKRGFARAQVERLTEYRNDASSTAGARNPRKDNSLTPGHDTDSELVEWWCIYTFLDGERTKVCTDGKFEEMLLKEAVNVQPLVTGQCFIAPHRLTGISVWDKLRQTQDVNTGLQRAMLDNVQATSKNRLAYLDGKANPDDIADGRVNGAIRVKASVSRVTDAVMPFVVPDTSSSIVSAIDHQRRIRTELGGSSLDMQAGEMQVSKQVGSLGLDRAFSVAEQLAAHMTQNIADTLIRSTFLVAHAQLRAHFDEAVPIKRNGRWETAIPSQWRERTGCTVNVGMSPGERTRRAATLDKMLQTQIQLDSLGLDDVLVNLDGFYALLMDWARVSGVPHPERYYVDPRSDESKQAQELKRQSQAQQQTAQQQLVKQAVELEKLRTAFDKYKADQDASIEVWKTQVEAKIEYAKLGQEAEIAEMNAVVPAAAKAIEGKREREGRKEPEGKSAPRADAA